MKYQRRAWALLGGITLVSCLSCVPKDRDEGKPAIQITKYILAKQDRAKTYALPNNKLHGIVSSLYGDVVYVVGSEASSLKALDVETYTWHDALGDFKDIKNSHDGKSSGDLSEAIVDGFAPTKNGLLFTLQKNKGLIVLKGFGKENANYYAQGDASFPKGPTTPFFFSNDDDQFIYLFPAKDLTKGIRYRAYVDPPASDRKSWQEALVVKAGKNTKAYWARTVDNDGNLLLGNDEGIRKIARADLGKAGLNVDKDVVVFAKPKVFAVNGKISNKHINTMAVVDKKFLVVGFKSANLPDTGGLAIADLSAPELRFEPVGLDLNVNVDSINTERIPNEKRTTISAIIATDQGFLLLGPEGKLIEAVKGKGYLINQKYINDNRAMTDNYDTASSGFLSDRIENAKTGSYLGAAQDRKGLWYLLIKGDNADENGLYTLDIRMDLIEHKRAPPELP